MKTFHSTLLIAVFLFGASAYSQLSKNMLPGNGKDIVELDKTPLPDLKKQPTVGRLSPDSLTDAFGFPIFVEIKEDNSTEQEEDLLAGGEIGRLVNKLNIQGLLPGQEALIESFVVPMGGAFAVKVKDNEVVLLHIIEITDTSITFGWAKDDTTYRYRIRSKTGDDVYLDLDDRVAQSQRRGLTQ